MINSKSETKQQKMVEAAVAILRNREKFLVVLRAPHIRAPNQICFPGGGVEAGETPHDAVVRELVEEVGIQVQPKRTVWTSRSAWDVLIHWVDVEFDFKQPICPNPDEVADFFWMTHSEITAVDNLLSSNRQFFEAWSQGAFRLD